MSQLKVAVLGANAFSGQDFIDLMLGRDDVEVLGISRSAERPACMQRYLARGDLSNFRFVKCDMNRDMKRLLDLLDAEKPHWIVNFAAQSEVAPSWHHPEQWFETNTVALAKLVNHLRRQNYVERYLHVSSPEAYGNCTGAVSEGAPDNPATPYAASKAAADMLLRTYRLEHGFPLLTVRATNVYGARQQLFKIIPRTVIYLRLGRKIPLHDGGAAVKSYIHVRDVSEGEKAILEQGILGELYHLSPDRGVAIREVVAAVCRHLDRPFEDSVEMAPRREGEVASFVIDSSKARKDFKWAPRITLDEGIAEVVDWVDANWSEISAAPLEYVHKP